MSHFIETIKIENGKAKNLFYHQQRMNKTIKDFFGANIFPDLATLISNQNFDKSKLLKCRILYSKGIHEIQFEEYKKKIIKRIKAVECNTIVYNYKYENRNELKALLSAAETDEIIIIKNGEITDTSYSNLVFEKNNNLLTPANPLLKGTKRQKLIDEGIIREEQVLCDNIKNFDFFYMINSMLELEESNRLPIEIIEY